MEVPKGAKTGELGANWPDFRIEKEIESLKRQIHCVFVIRSLDKPEMAL
jgi:hypothetical protein